MEERYFVQLGKTRLDMRTVVPDIRGVEDIVREAIEEDWAEMRYSRFHLKMFPFPDAADMAEWDRFLLERYPPLYTSPQLTCCDCPQGPCCLEEAKGKCGLELEPYQAKLSLLIACRGCLSQLMDSRELLNYAIKVFGREKPVSFGKQVTKADLDMIRLLTALDPKNLGDLDRAQSYAEAQLTKLTWAGLMGTGSVEDFEEMAFHAGSLLLMTQTVAELIKASLFGFTNAGDEEAMNQYNYPPPTTEAGLGSVDRTKPVILFVGDSFLPAWVAVNHLKEKGLAEQIELCGIGPAADDGIRFYDRFRNIGPIMQAKKIIRGGLADVIVAGSACINLDILGEAKRVESRVIWTGREGSMGLPDRTVDPVEEIVKDLVGGAEGAWIRDPEKAAEVAVRVVQQVRRKGDYVLSEEKAREEAAKCKEDCDLCFTVCPNSLLLNKAVRGVKKEGLQALSEVEMGCYFCGKCEEACPAKIALLDLIVAAQEKRAPKEKFVMRAGRGTELRDMIVAWAYSTLNITSQDIIIGCGNANPDDLAWMANQLVSSGAVVWVAGCAGTQVARHYDEVEQKFIFKKFPTEPNPRNLLNSGGCTACSLAAVASLKWVRTGTFASVYGNLAEHIDVQFPLWMGSAIIWGALPERMYTLAAGLVRLGYPVIIGPTTEFDWKRFLISDRWDWKKWWAYDILEHRTKPTEPGKKQMIIPVETKEEAIVMAQCTSFYPATPASVASIKLDNYIGWSEKFFGEWPDDWYKFIRNPVDLGTLRYKARMVKRLGEEHGWEVHRVMVLKARHPDGRLMDFEQLSREYSAPDGRAITYLPHRVREKPLTPGEGGK